MIGIGLSIILEGSLVENSVYGKFRGSRSVDRLSCCCWSCRECEKNVILMIMKERGGITEKLFYEYHEVKCLDLFE